MKENLKKGDKVQVRANHWARGRQEGKIKTVDGKGVNNFEVEFKDSGIGIDGTSLWFSQNDLQLVE